MDAQGKSEPANLIRNGYLSEGVVRSSFQSAVQRFINQYKGPNRLNLSTHGPAITLGVHQDNSELFSLDLVPMVQLGKNWLILKPHPDSVNNPSSEKSILWRRSFTHQESHYASNLPEEYKKVLKIVKAIRHKCYTQMGMMPSYVYKTAFLHWYYNEQNRLATVGERVKNFLYHLSKTLRGGLLRPFRDASEDVNPLKCYKSSSLINVSNFIHALARSEENLRASFQLSNESAIMESVCTPDYHARNDAWAFLRCIDNICQNVVHCSAFLVLMFITVGVLSVLISQLR